MSVTLNKMKSLIQDVFRFTVLFFSVVFVQGKKRMLLHSDADLLQAYHDLNAKVTRLSH